jgi:hypothetical protein
VSDKTPWEYCLQLQNKMKGAGEGCCNDLGEGPGRCRAEEGDLQLPQNCRQIEEKFPEHSDANEAIARVFVAFHNGVPVRMAHQEIMSMQQMIMGTLTQNAETDLTDSARVPAQHKGEVDKE